MKNVIHKGLEKLWRISQSISHYIILVMTRCSTKCGLPFVALKNTHEAICAHEVMFGVNTCSPELLDRRGH